MISRFVKGGSPVSSLWGGWEGGALGRFIRIGSDRIEDCGMVSSSLLRPRKTRVFLFGGGGGGIYRGVPARH